MAGTNTGPAGPRRSRLSRVVTWTERLFEEMQSKFSMMFWVVLGLLFIAGLIIVFLRSKGGDAGGTTLEMTKAAQDVCTDLAKQACGLPFGADTAPLFSAKPDFKGNDFAEKIWDHVSTQQAVKASVSPSAFFIACMSKLKSEFGTDRFEMPQKLLSTREQDLSQVWANEDGSYVGEITAGNFTILGFDPSAKHFASANFMSQWNHLKPSRYLADFTCDREDTLQNIHSDAAAWRTYMDQYRAFVNIKKKPPPAFAGYGSRMSHSRCEWVPQHCDSTGGPPRPIVDLSDPDPAGPHQAKGSKLVQPPWNAWPESLSDDLFADIVFSVHGALLQAVNRAGLPRYVGFEAELSPESADKSTLITGSPARYVVPTAWMAEAQVRSGYRSYGVDVYFDANRQLVGMYDPMVIPKFLNKPSSDDEAKVEQWTNRKLKAMASILVLQSLGFHVADKVTFGGTMWTALYQMPVGHPVRSIMAPFGHGGLEEALAMYTTTLEDSDFVLRMTALTKEGWKFIVDEALLRAKRWSHSTGDDAWFQSRGLADARLPLHVHGSRIREAQRKFMLKAIKAWALDDNPTMENHTRTLRTFVRKFYGVKSDSLMLDTHERLATFLSELLYRQSVPHTLAGHHSICHSTMANAKIFPMQLLASDSGPAMPASEGHMLSSIVWELKTEPMPRITFPLDLAKSFKHITDYLRKDQTAMVTEAFAEFRDSLEKLDNEVRQYNADRCKAKPCLPYSCVMPRELLLSYGI